MVFFLRLCVFFVGIISIIFLSISHWLYKTFGNININQAIWHIKNVDLSILMTVDPDFKIRCLKFSLFIFILISFWFFLTFKYKFICNLIKKFLIHSRLKNKKVDLCISCYEYSSVKILFVVSLLLFSICILKIDRQFDIISYIKEPNLPIASEYIENNYSVPDIEAVVFKEKKNLVIVLAESFENTFSNVDGISYTANIDKVRNNAIKNFNMYNTSGTNWTIAAITGWFFGLPLKTPNGINGNGYISKNGFLPHALSVFDVLQHNGFESVLVIGSDKRFYGMDQLFSMHGGFKILDKSAFEADGWNLAANAGTSWGFNDSFVLARASEEYARLKKQTKPFVLFIQTIDTHAPNGYCPQLHKKFYDIRDAIVEADSNLGKFSEQFVEDDNTVYILLGDHLFMGSPQFLSNNMDRTIYNLFHGKLPLISKAKQHEKISAVDIAPTLLHCAGGKWGNDKFGLGVSLFSDDHSLLQRDGISKFNSEIMKDSTFYSKFY